MRLELHIDERLFAAMPMDEFKILDDTYNMSYRVPRNEKAVSKLVSLIKEKFNHEICKGGEFKIFFVVESKGEIMENEE